MDVGHYLVSFKKILLFVNLKSDIIWGQVAVPLYSSHIVEYVSASSTLLHVLGKDIT